MGVFARLLRRSKAAEEASTAEAQAVTPAADPEADRADEAKGSNATAEAGAEATAEEPAPKDSGAGDDVEIPKQQTAGKAADNEAGEGARR
jgi:hypothetical protein